MSKTRWVQHISGKGEKRELLSDTTVANNAYVVQGENSYFYYLPKSEYILCEPPERWVDVTKDIVESATPGNWQHCGQDVLGMCDGYALRKVRLYHDDKGWCHKDALLIEKQEPA